MLDWGTIAALTVAVAAVAGIIIQAIKREKPWKRSQNEHNLRLITLELHMKAVEEKIDTLKQTVEDHDHRDEKDFERIEAKIEKLTDLMIGMLSSSGKNKSSTSKTKK